MCACERYICQRTSLCINNLVKLLFYATFDYYIGNLWYCKRLAQGSKQISCKSIICTTLEIVQNHSSESFQPEYLHHFSCHVWFKMFGFFDFGFFFFFLVCHLLTEVMLSFFMPNY